MTQPAGFQHLVVHHMTPMAVHMPSYGHRCHVIDSNVTNLNPGAVLLVVAAVVAGDILPARRRLIIRRLNTQDHRGRCHHGNRVRGQDRFHDRILPVPHGRILRLGAVFRRTVEATFNF